MTINFKTLFYIFLLISGYYVFYIEYFNLNDLRDNFIQNNEKEVSIFNNQKENKKNNDIHETKNTKEDIYNKKIIKNDKYINIFEVKVNEGDTFLSILRRENLSEEKIFKIINEIQKIYDLRNLKVDEDILFYRNSDEEISKIDISIDIDKLLSVEIVENKITVKTKVLEKISNQSSNEYYISNSLYMDGLENGIPQDILIKLIRLFSFDLDFQRDIKNNTLISISYDYNLIKENNKIEYKDIVYALISIEGKDLEYFKFITDDGFVDYFNREGKNVKKSILKTPLDGARISSNFGMRKHPISGFNKMHKGVDFAAPTGTPIYAGGNGVIEFLGTNGGYGKYIRIRHNNGYKTAYAHLSKYKKGISKSIRVNQGDVIGYVGNTGNSTGPHLHYEIMYNGKHVNPLKLKLPSGKVLKDDELKRFTQEYKQIYANHLNLLYE